MNEEWALEQLGHFRDLTRTTWRTYDMGSFEEIAGSEEEIVKSAHVTEQILDRVTPGWRRAAAATLPDGLWKPLHAATLRAITEIETAAEVRENLGDIAPTMTAGAMHPWVWGAARSLWQSNHFGEAVAAAAVKVNAELQNKVSRRDVSETALFQQCFSNEPPSAGKARLRPVGDDDGATALSVRRGIVALAEGVYAGIRNPASHDGPGDPPEQVALERLATISLLARWVDSCSLLTV